MRTEEEQPGVQVRLFGGVSARTDSGEPVEVGPAKCQLVLAALALDPGAAVPVSRLVELVWGDDPPRTAERTLQSYIARLRRGLGPTSIVRTGSAYRLDLAPERVDVLRFEQRLAAGGDPAGALAEWTGAPLAGLDAPGLVPVVDRVVEGWLTATEADLAARLERDPASVLPPLAELTVRHPFREGLWALLMTALYRCGRQADALAAYGRARRILVEELGLEPGPRLRELEAFVLEHDERLGPPAAVTERPDAREPTRATAGPHKHLTPLPHTLPRLIGRDEEVPAIAAALVEHRLVTLTGPGGVGKTTVAVAAAHRTGSDHEACFVDLSMVSADADVARATADALQIGDQPGPALSSGIVAAIGTGPALLVLDNCEQVLDGAAALTREVLSGCPRAQVLATSREPLGLVGERVFAVGPLDVRGAAVELFVERASAASPGFDADAHHDQVLDLCHRLDGVPLALELAAARTRTLTPGDLLARLDDDLRILAGPRARPARHRTLRAAVQWSYDLLDDPERTVFQRLSVFPGPFDLRAAEAIASGGHLDPLDVDDLLDRLVQQSMVAVQPAAGGLRFRLLAAMRQLAAEHLDASPDRHAVRDRHTGWCLEEVATVGNRLTGAGEAEAVERLQERWPDLRAAVDRACTAGDPHLARDLVEPVAAEVFLRSRSEIGDWVERILALAPPGDDDLITFGLMWVARRHLRHRDHAGYERLARRSGEPDHVLVRHARALVYEDHERLAGLCPDAAALLRAQGRTYLADLYEIGQARALLALGRLDEHDVVVAALVDRFRAQGPPTFLHWTLAMHGYSLVRQGRRDEADARFVESAAVEVPPGTHSRNQPVAVRAAARAGQQARAFGILRDHAEELLERRDLYEARLIGVDVVNLLAAADRLGDAAKFLGYLDGTGLLGTPAFAALVADTAARVERIVPDHARLRRDGRRLDDRAALALMRSLADELARREPLPQPS